MPLAQLLVALLVVVLGIGALEDYLWRRVHYILAHAASALSLALLYTVYGVVGLVAWLGLIASYTFTIGYADAAAMTSTFSLALVYPQVGVVLLAGGLGGWLLYWLLTGGDSGIPWWVACFYAALYTALVDVNVLSLPAA